MFYKSSAFSFFPFALLALSSSASCPTFDSDDKISVPMATGGIRSYLLFPVSNSCPFICIEITFWDEWVVPSRPNLCLSEQSEHFICVLACQYDNEHSPRDVNDEADSEDEPDQVSLSFGPHFNIAFGHVVLLQSYFIKQPH